MSKIIYAVGHTASGNLGSGAVGIINESNCTREVAPLCAKYTQENGVDAAILRIDKSNSYTFEDCYVRADQANGIGGDLYAEIHFNSGGAGATGVEVLVNSLGGEAEKYAKGVCEKLSKALGIPNRGVKQQNLIVLKRTHMTAILIECHFVGNPDAALYNADTIAKAIVSGILNKDIKSEWVQGWNKSNGKWWYSPDPKNKTYYKNEWKLIDGKWYLFDSAGWALTGWVYYQTYADKKDVWYHLDDDYSMAVGWRKVDNDWYHFNSSGEMETGWIKDDGKDYCLYSNGKMIHDTVLYGYLFSSNGEATKM